MDEGVVIESVPAEVGRAARDAFDRYRRDVPVADLVYDSVLYTPVGSTPLRTLRYSRDTETVTVQIEAIGDDRRHLTVEIPWQVAAELTVSCGDWSRRLTTQPDGRAEVREAPSGVLSIRVDAAELGSVQTAHVRI